METKDSQVATPEADQLVHEMLGRIADKWTLLVIEMLGDEEMRFSRLRDRVGNISQKMLTKTLRQLERDGLITRHVYAEVPPRVDYKLTPLGLSLAEALCGLWMWAEKHVNDVTKARAKYDKRS